MKRFAVYCLTLALAGAIFTNGVVGAPQTLDNVPTKESASYRDVVKKVLPAVVSIQGDTLTTSRKQVIPKEWPFDEKEFGLPEEFKKFFDEKWLEDFRERPWREFRRQQFQLPDSFRRVGIGSGFVVDPEGIILTNHHVVADVDRVVVKFQDGRTYTTSDIKSDPHTDLAIVRIDAKEALPYLKLGDSDAMEIGDKVLAVGAPFGLMGSVTHGIISGVRRSMGVNRYEDFIQTDAAINPGNSGGPLVNLHGEVVGVNSAIKTRTGGFQGVGMAVSSNLARKVMKQLLENGTVRRAFLGVQIRDLDQETADKLKVKEGAVVVRVVPDSPADSAGIKEGDVITRINDEPIDNSRELQHLVASLPMDSEAKFTLLRDGETRTLSVKLREQPEDFEKLFGFNAPTIPHNTSTTDTDARGGTSNLDRLGLRLADPAEVNAPGWVGSLLEMAAEMVRHLSSTPYPQGALIVEVEPDSLAAMANLEPGMWIVKVNDQSVLSATEAREAIEKASLTEGIRLMARDQEGGVHHVRLRADF